jgi:hypothetical protein
LSHRPVDLAAGCPVDFPLNVIPEHNDQLSSCDTSKVLNICSGNLPKSSVAFSPMLEVWHPPTSPSVCVLCDHWPVWLFGLIALPCTISRTYLPSFPLAWFKHLQETFPRLSFMTDPFHYTSEDIIFLHGTKLWFDQILLLLPPAVPVVSSFTFDPKVPMQSPGCYTLQSAHAGSVVDRQWMFWSHSVGSVLPSPNSYTRFIKHILDVTDRSMRRFASAPTEVVSTTMHLPQHRPLTVVQCSSVYAPNALVWRSLSSIELGRAYDIPTAILL